MSIARKPQEANPRWGEGATLGSEPSKKGSRIYQSRSSPTSRSSHFRYHPTRKDDSWWWENRAKPGYVRAILRQLTLSSARLSLRESKLSLPAHKYLEDNVIPICAASDKSAGQSVLAPTTGITTMRVSNLTESEWKYWRRRIQRDRADILGLDTVYSIPLQDGTYAIVTCAHYTLIPGQNFEGEATLSKVLNEILDNHDRKRVIRGNHGAQKTADRDRTSDWEWVETTELTSDEFYEELQRLLDEGKVKWLDKNQREEAIRHYWTVVEGHEHEVQQRLKVLPRAKQTS